jgi:2-polyprenyl-6-hydroxyphenyl methylase/3-demethylubiquinone-9 3-methyltransferase
MRNDLTLYERHADQWWDSAAEFFRSLRSVKRFHLELLLELCAEELPGATVVDLGCGGGLFALPVAERGARVVGLDLSARSLAAGRREAERRGARASFVRADLCRAPLAGSSAQLVLLSDVIEHVEDPAGALREAARLLVPGGGLFVNTFDEGWLAALCVVHAAEGLGLVPRGTHDPRLFVSPKRLDGLAKEQGLRLERLQREAPRLLKSLFSRTVHLRRSASGFGYTAFFRKIAT